MDSESRGGPSAQPVLAFLSALPDAAFVIGRDDKVACVNAAARTMFPGLRAGELIHWGVRVPDILDAAREARAAGRPVEAVWLDRFPVERRFHIHAAPLGESASDRPILVTLRDTTEWRRAERMRADFVANASHELRTPLAALVGFLDTWGGGARHDPAARERSVGNSRYHGRRWAGFIDDLLSLSRIEQHAHVRPQGAVDLAAVAAQTTDALSQLARDGDVTVRLEAAGPVGVTGDRDALLRGAENLGENAIKYGGAGAVAIRVLCDEGWAVLEVEDAGPGIAAEHLPRLTERFYRVDAQNSRTKGGTGLGLSIVKHIVARHRGHLQIASNLGQGSRFQVRLPSEPNESRSPERLCHTAVMRRS